MMDRHGGGLVWLAWAVVACIIPDDDPRVDPNYDNPGAVRLVSAIPLTEQANLACREAAIELAACPLPPETLSFGLIALDAPFCRCPGRDGNALRFFDIFVEDPDLDPEGRPKDSIFGALLLDVPADADDPSTHLAYDDILPPNQAASLVQQSGFGSYFDAIDRPTPVLRSWTLGPETGVDLCNGNPGAVDGKLAPGVHSLKLVVTDRPWYRPVRFDDAHRVLRGEDGLPLHHGPAQARPGVPDVPAGASYAVADFVFRCGDSGQPDSSCNCEVEDTP